MFITAVLRSFILPAWSFPGIGSGVSPGLCNSSVIINWMQNFKIGTLILFSDTSQAQAVLLTHKAFNKYFMKNEQLLCLYILKCLNIYILDQGWAISMEGVFRKDRAQMHWLLLFSPCL